MLPICTIAGISVRPVIPVRFRAASSSYMMPFGLSAMRNRWRAVGLAAQAGGVAGAFTMGTMLALLLPAGLADHPEAPFAVAVGAAP
jgi:hypothetical protein